MLTAVSNYLTQAPILVLPINISGGGGGGGGSRRCWWPSAPLAQPVPVHINKLSCGSKNMYYASPKRSHTERKAWLGGMLGPQGVRTAKYEHKWNKLSVLKMNFGIPEPLSKVPHS